MTPEKWIAAVTTLAAVLLGGDRVYQSQQPASDCSVWAEVLQITAQQYHEQLMLIRREGP